MLDQHVLASMLAARHYVLCLKTAAAAEICFEPVQDKLTADIARHRVLAPPAMIGQNPELLACWIGKMERLPQVVYYRGLAGVRRTRAGPPMPRVRNETVDWSAAR